MTKRKLIGVLTPSSNTALEPLTSAMVSRMPGVSAHFSRFTVTEISLRDPSLNQFDDSKILEAARLLADAHVDVICWSGTSASWLGFEKDRQLWPASPRPPASRPPPRCWRSTRSWPRKARAPWAWSRPMWRMCSGASSPTTRA